MAGFHLDDTIAAVSTAMAPAGIGIVRISGNDAFEVADRVFRAKKEGKKLSAVKSHTIHYGWITEGEEVIDEVLVMVMKGPKTYTGENTVEIDCHGGVLAVKKVLEAVLNAGARAADPGEFTKRAFLNGRMDLTQAEAVMDVISAKSAYALKSSESQLRGTVKKAIRAIRKKLIYEIAFIESALDDPEHISLDGYPKRLAQVVAEQKKQVEKLLASADEGKMIQEGIKTVILGKPNAGKSSLMNAFLGEDRAIVTDIAGTTRDVLEEHINLQGISLNIMDTAGIRDTEDIVEKIGVDKAINYAKDADLILFVIDASSELDENDIEILKMIQGKQAIILLNKSDLDMIVTKKVIENKVNELQPVNSSETENHNPIIEVSAKEKSGIAEFEQILKDMFYDGKLTFNDEIYITNVRQKTALQEAYRSLQKVNESIEMGMPEDFYSIDLLDAYESLGSITGETIGEDLVNEIFSKFCMGK